MFSSNNSRTPNKSARAIFGDLSNMGAEHRSRNNISDQAGNVKGTARENQKKAMRKREITPSRSVDVKTGQVIGDGDRYVGVRTEEQLEIAQHLMRHTSNENLLETSSSTPCSPATKAERDMKLRIMRTKSLNDVSSSNGQTDMRIISYKRGLAPKPPVGYRSKPAVLYTCVQPSSSVKRSQRYLPKSPVRILDAPNILDDFYYNVLDWSRTNVVAVALSDAIYLWNAESGSVTELVSFDGINVSSLKWSGEGKYLSVGLEDGNLKLFDTQSQRCLRTMRDGRLRIGCISWRKNVVSYGCRSGSVYHHDVRTQQSMIGNSCVHTAEVCGLKWSADEKHLTSGGADNAVNVWDDRQINAGDNTSIYRFDDHVAAVKAIEYVPFIGMNSNMVATGGGTTDQSVKVWNLSTGALHSSLNTENQVSGILFNKHFKEMCTSHGTPRSFLRFYRYNSRFDHFADLDGHTGRIVSMAQSPDGEFVLSASSDETLRLWNCWKRDKSVNSLSSSMRKLNLTNSSTVAPSLR